jgi:phosphoglycolate phosphatase
MTSAQEAHVLGPPFYESLPEIVGADRVAEVITAYRIFYSDAGMFDTVAYAGVAELLDWLAASGVTLAVATSKPEHFAVPIVAHLGFSARFATICGDTLDGARGSKALVVQEALDRLGQPDPSTVVMVGDRSHDVFGAAAAGVPCYGAGWGYGAPGELAGAGAIAVCGHPSELRLALAARIAARTEERR